jgi:CheY-like chemotaxis protein
MAPKIILLADPDANCRELLRQYFEILGYPTPIEASDGEETLSQALTERPHLIVMEVRLPKIDGFQIVAQLKSNPLTRNTCILAATAMALPQDREKCLAKGFDAYLAKPFTLKELKGLLQTILSDGTNHNPL